MPVPGLPEMGQSFWRWPPQELRKCSILLNTAIFKVEIITLNYLIGYKEWLVQFHSEKWSVLLLYFEIDLNISLYGCVLSGREAKV